MNWNRNDITRRRLTVLIVDTHLSVCEMVGMALLREECYNLADEATSAKQALQLFEKFKPHLVILGLEFPDMTSVELIQQMRAQNSNARFLIYSGSNDERIILQGIQQEPQGFIHKSESLETLIQAANVIAFQDGTYFGKYATSVLNQSRISGANIQNDVALTPRQKSVLQLVAEGLSSKEVAARLELSPRTIEHYRKHLMQKLGINCVAKLTLYAARCGLVRLGTCTIIFPSAF